MSRQLYRVPGWSGIGPRLTASATSIGEPSGIPGGLATVNSPRTSTGWAPSGVSTRTGRPSASSKNSSQWWAMSASCQSTSILSATAEGTGSGPVMLQPPPRM